MEALAWITIGLVAGWHIRSEVQFWHELDMRKIRRDAIKDEPATTKHQPNIIWARDYEERDRLLNGLSQSETVIICGEGTLVGPYPIMRQ